MLKRTVMSYYYDDDDVNFTRKMCVSIVCWLFDGVSRSLLYDRASLSFNALNRTTHMK